MASTKDFFLLWCIVEKCILSEIQAFYFRNSCLSRRRRFFHDSIRLFRLRGSSAKYIPPGGYVCPWLCLTIFGSHLKLYMSKGKASNKVFFSTWVGHGRNMNINGNYYIIIIQIKQQCPFMREEGIPVCRLYQTQSTSYRLYALWNNGTISGTE